MLLEQERVYEIPASIEMVEEEAEQFKVLFMLIEYTFEEEPSRKSKSAKVKADV